METPRGLGEVGEQTESGASPPSACVSPSARLPRAGFRRTATVAGTHTAARALRGPACGGCWMMAATPPCPPATWSSHTTRSHLVIAMDLLHQRKKSLCHKQVKGSKIQNSELSIDFGPDGDFMQAHRAIALPPPMRPCFSGDAARRGPDFPFLSAAMQPFHWGKLRASLRWSQLLRGPSCPHIPPGMVAGSVHLLAHQGPPSPCLGHSSSREAGTPHTWPPRGSGLSADLRASCRGHTLLVPVDP